MKIIYVHHAMREKGKPPSQLDDITSLGEKDAGLYAEIFNLVKDNGINIKAIYTSPFLRCKKTSEIINSKMKVPIFEEDRFNEFGSEEGESWVDLQKRVRLGIKDIVAKYNNEDAVICVTSGVNVVSFISLAYKLKPSESAPFIGIVSCSPLIFEITNENFD
ncbi:MAG: histidine phosphatase family protein [Clostridia bacterium]|nr:histidine phosphatase family protein [Clostridia bacterium]